MLADSVSLQNDLKSTAAVGLGLLTQTDLYCLFSQPLCQLVDSFSDGSVQVGDSLLSLLLLWLVLELV